MIRPAAFWADRDISVSTRRRSRRGGCGGASLRPTLRASRHRYGTLVWATGGGPRRLACDGHDLAGVHAIRTRADVDALHAELGAANRVVVVGGGYIGLEAAAVLTRMGKQVIVLEALDRVLARVAGEPLSRFYEAEHRAQGVEVRLGAMVSSLVGREGRVVAVTLARQDRTAGGRRDRRDRDSSRGGRTGCRGGVGRQRRGRSTHTAAPICPTYTRLATAPRTSTRFAGGQVVRVESVQNASDQANTAAKAIMGEAATYDAVPWFWSNQYDLKLQTVGLSTGHDQVVVRGAVEDRRFSVVYLRRRPGDRARLRQHDARLRPRARPG